MSKWWRQRQGSWDAQWKQTQWSYRWPREWTQAPKVETQTQPGTACGAYWESSKNAAEAQPDTGLDEEETQTQPGTTSHAYWESSNSADMQVQQLQTETQPGSSLDFHWEISNNGGSRQVSEYGSGDSNTEEEPDIKEQGRKDRDLINARGEAPRLLNEAVRASTDASQSVARRQYKVTAWACLRAASFWLRMAEVLASEHGGVLGLAGMTCAADLLHDLLWHPDYKIKNTWRSVGH